MGQHAGAPIVLTAPLTESIDHAGFFIQMSLASIPGWMEWVIDKKYPTWRDVPRTAQGGAATAPAGLRVLEAVLAQAELSAMLLDRSPIQLKAVSTHPEHRALAPLIGIGTGSVRIARQIMAGKALPFDIKDWPHIVLNGLAILNRHNWFPVCTLIVGSPGETDEDSMATLDLLYEVECRGLQCMWVPSIFTPLVKTRMEQGEGVRETQQLSALQWQVIMKAWAFASRIGLQTRWGKLSFGAGALALWAARLRRVNGPNFTWPLMQFSGAIPERWLEWTGRIYAGRPLPRVTRDELLAMVRRDWRQAIVKARQGAPMTPGRGLRMAAV